MIGAMNMMENMVMITFENIEDAKRAYATLKKSTNDASMDFTALQTVLVQNDGGKITVLDQHAEVFSELGKTMIGGVVGVVLGVLIGPFAGFVLGGVGAMIGSGFDITDQSESEDMLYQMYSRIYNGDIALLSIIQEDDELVLNSMVGKNAIDIYRWDAAEIREEAEYATSVRDVLIKEGRKKMRAEKNESRIKRITEYKDMLKDEFNKIGK